MIRKGHIAIQCQMCGRRHPATIFNDEYGLWVCEGANAYLDGQYDEVVPHRFGATR